MFTRIVKESLIRKRRRKIVAVASVMLGASIATAVLGVGLGIGDKVNHELRAYGANIEVLPRDRSVQVTSGGVQYQAAAAGSLLNEQDLPKLRSIFWSNNILAFAPFLAVSVRARIPARGGDDVQVNLIGTWFEKNVTVDNGAAFLTGVKRLTPWWKIDGGWPSQGEGLIGVRLAQALKAGPGDDLLLQSTTRDGSSIETRLRVSGILATGSDEDRRIIG